MNNLLLFLKAVLRAWIASLGCAAFTVLGVYIAYTNKSNRWTFWADIALALICLMSACFMAWMDKHKEVARFHQEYDEGKPRVAFTVLRPKTMRAWHTLDDCRPVPLFFLEHYGGSAARFVRIDPLTSTSGLFTAKFDEVPVLGGPGRPARQVAEFTIYQNNVTDLSQYPEILKIQQGVDMLTSFFRDHPPDQGQGTYRITIRFRDQDSTTEHVEHYALLCECPRHVLSVVPG